VRLHLARSGGFANIRLEGTIETADLPPDLAGRAERLLDPANLARAQHGGNPHMADAYVYELQVWPEGEGRDQHSYLLSEADTSAEVMDTLHDVMATITRG
jgi:hypothetical protein